MKYLPFFLVLLFIGCGKAAPPGLPPLAPCKIKVHNNGQPLVKIGVSFQRTEGQAGWSLNGQTDSNGVAIAQTIAGSFDAKGIPTGTYRVTLSERIELPPELLGSPVPVQEVSAQQLAQQLQDLTQKRQKYLAERRTLPEILCDPAKTPLELTVSSSGAELDVDVSKFK